MSGIESVSGGPNGLSRAEDPQSGSNLSSLMSDFLSTLESRVLSSTAPSGPGCRPRTSAAEDFGGPESRGCNENLVLTRPDLVAQMHREYFEAGVDAVETATFGAFGLVLAEYGSPTSPTT